MKHKFILIIFAITFYSACNEKFCQGDNWTLRSVEIAKKIYASYKSWNNHDQGELFGTTCKLTFGRHFFLQQRRWKGKFFESITIKFSIS